MGVGRPGCVGAERHFLPWSAAAAPRPTLRDGRDQGRNPALGPGWGYGETPLVAAVGHGRVEHHARSGSPPGRRFAVLQRRRVDLSRPVPAAWWPSTWQPGRFSGVCLSATLAKRTGATGQDADDARIRSRTPSYNANGPVPRWLDGTATIVNGRVLLTPAEADALYCLNLADGKPAWDQPQQPRGEHYITSPAYTRAWWCWSAATRSTPSSWKTAARPGAAAPSACPPGPAFAATAVMPAGNTSCRSAAAR